MQVNPDLVNTRKRAREIYEEILDLVQTELTANIPKVDDPTKYRHILVSAFWALMAEHGAGMTGKMVCPIVEVDRMDSKEAIEFEKTKVEFGLHAGLTVGEIPTGYWVQITESDFNRQLVRYMRSDRFKKFHYDHGQ